MYEWMLAICESKGHYGAEGLEPVVTTPEVHSTKYEVHVHMYVVHRTTWSNYSIPRTSSCTAVRGTMYHSTGTRLSVESGLLVAFRYRTRYSDVVVLRSDLVVRMR